MADPYRLVNERFVSMRTPVRYIKQVELFKAWLKTPAGRRHRAQHTRDEVLAAYVNHLRDKGGCLYQATYLSAALGVYPGWSGHMKLMNKSIRVWENKVDPEQAIPVPEDVMWGIAVQLRELKRWMAMAIWLLSYDSFMRPGILAKVKRKDVVWYGGSRLQGLKASVGLVISRNKRGLPRQVATCEHPVSLTIIKWLLRRRGRDDDPLVPGYNNSEYNKHLKEAQCRLGLPDNVYSGYSTRHGAACKALLEGKSQVEIMDRGLWESVEATRKYLRRNKMAYMRQQIPLRIIEKCGTYQLMPKIALAVDLLPTLE